MSSRGKVDLKSIINEIRDTKLVADNDMFSNTARALEKRVNSKEFRIVVIGEFSAGKSTFINALLSKDLLRHATKETTATITYIHNVKKDDLRIGTCDVHLSDGNQLRLPNLDSLQEYTTTLAKRKVVDEVESVSIYTHFIDVEEDIVIVDTPGLNGIADKHRELTIEEIKRSHACIYLFQRRGVALTDIAFIKYIMAYQSTFVFIQNFIDELKISEGETTEDKLKSMKTILCTEVFKEETSMISASFCAISALKGLVGKDNTIRYLYKDDTSEIDCVRRLAIYEESNFESLLKTLKALITEEKFEENRYQDECRSLLFFLQILIEEGEERQDTIQEALERIGVLDSLKKLENQKDSLSANRDKYLTLLDNLIVSQFADNKRQLLQEIDSLMNGVKDKMELEINQVSSYRDFEQKTSNSYFVNHLKQLVATCQIQIQQDEVDFFQGVYRLVLTRMNEYSHSIGEVEEVQLTTTQVQNTNIFESKAKKDEIRKIEAELDQSKAEVTVAREKLERLKSDIAKFDDAIKANKDKMGQLKNRTVSEERNLGQRPKIREYNTKETYYEDREGFGGKLLQFFIGQKERTRNVTCYDDSDGEKWDKKKQDINEKADKERNIIKNEINQNENKKARIQTECDQAESVSKIKVDRIKRYEKDIQAKKEELKMFEEGLEKEYLIARKKQLVLDIGNYLTDGEDSLTVHLKANVMGDTGNNVLLVQKQTIKEFDKRLKEKQKMLDQLIAGNMDEINDNYKGLAEELDKLYQNYEVLKEAF